MGDVDPLVVRTARSIGKQQVGFDGLVSLAGAGVLDVAASPQSLPLALHLYNVLLTKVRERGGEVSATDATVIHWRDEAVRIRLREYTERRETTDAYGYRSNTSSALARIDPALLSKTDPGLLI